MAIIPRIKTKTDAPPTDAKILVTTAESIKVLTSSWLGGPGLRYTPRTTVSNTNANADKVRIIRSLVVNALRNSDLTNAITGNSHRSE